LDLKILTVFDKENLRIISARKSTNQEVERIEYFKTLAKKVDIPYQNLINSYLSDCAKRMFEPKFQWGELYFKANHFST